MNTNSKEIRIMPLSKDTLDEATSLIRNVFPYKPDQKNAQWSFSDSLSITSTDKNYWVAVDKEEHVIGITGLYLDRNDKSVVWLGWFGVHPAHRRHGIGSELLSFTIDEAKKRCFLFLKLYTSSDENEKAAHHLYKKIGFMQLSVDKKTDKIYFLKNLTEESMSRHDIKIEWDGPFTLNEVIGKLVDGGGKENNWDGKDYGIYQIYGKHILYGENTLLYVGIATKQTFSQRFNQHETWLLKDQSEEHIKIYVGRIYDPKKHREENNWESWEKDIEVAEKIIIYKYSPNYNSRELSDAPVLSPHKNISLVHLGKKGRLKAEDNAPDDFFI